MALSDRLWDALSTVIKMNDRIVTLSGQMNTQQRKIEDLTARVVRLETALEIALAAQGRKRLT
jgi:uncharacterized coiled-coil protein SlyX